tara:strand:- start:2141 stop:2296 length:156 start_codon:yes stop_codon:yes gene_type:complete
MTTLDMLMAREQLMEDIISIMEGNFPNECTDEVISFLCDAVCENFPTQEAN